MRAVALRSSSRNSYPPNDMVLWKPTVLKVSLSGGAYILSFPFVKLYYQHLLYYIILHHIAWSPAPPPRDGRPLLFVLVVKAYVPEGLLVRRSVCFLCFFCIIWLFRLLIRRSSFCVFCCSAFFVWFFLFRGPSAPSLPLLHLSLNLLYILLQYLIYLIYS